jgi:septal ring factor EnvC (AmiA/AmiB activator)
MFTRKIRAELEASCSSIREELDDHREAINEQARDALEIREALSELDEKMEKLSSRIDEMYLLLGADAALSEREKALVSFLQTPRSSVEVESWLATSAAGVDRFIRILTLKGVAVHQLSDGALTANPSLKYTAPLHEYF